MATMTNDDRRALVDKMVRAMNERDLDLLDAVMSANFVRHCEPTPDLVIKDLDGYKAFLDAFTEGFRTVSMGCAGRGIDECWCR